MPKKKIVELPKEIDGLSTKEKRVLEAIYEFSIESNFQFPTYREISKIANILSTATVSKILKSLEEKGYILDNYTNMIDVKYKGQRSKNIAKNISRKYMLNIKQMIENKIIDEKDLNAESNNKEIAKIGIKMAKIPFISTKFYDKEQGKYSILENDIKEYMSFPIEYSKEKTTFCIRSMDSKLEKYGIIKNSYVLIDLNERPVARDVIGYYDFDSKKIYLKVMKREDKKNLEILGRVIGSYTIIEF